MLFVTVFAVISAALTGVVYLTAAPSPWWILPLWAALYLAVGVTYILLLLLAGVLLPLDTPTKATYRVYQWFIHHTLQWVLSILGVCYTVTGLDKLPTDRPFLWVCNHRHALDPVVTLAALSQWSVAFIAKPGAFKIPVIGAIMRRVCFLPINRESARAAVTTIKQAAALISQKPGISVGIYPEGTRSRNGVLLPFHAGSFKIAAMAHCPVVVAALQMEKGLLGLPRQVKLSVVDVMEETFVQEHKTDVLAERAREAIRIHIGQ